METVIPVQRSALTLLASVVILSCVVVATDAGASPAKQTAAISRSAVQQRSAHRTFHSHLLAKS